jgi:hypothetical protein
MSIPRFFPKPSLEAARRFQFSTVLTLATLGAGGFFLTVRSSSLLYSIIIISYFYLRFPLAVSQLMTLLTPCWLWRLGSGYRTTGLVFMQHLSDGVSTHCDKFIATACPQSLL